MKRALFVVAVLVVLIFACKHTPVEVPDDTIYEPPIGDTTPVTPPCSPDSIYFQEQVLPIFQSSCAIPECHDAITHEEGMILDSYEGILDSDELWPGNSSLGDIPELIQETDPDDVMPPPPYSPLSGEQVQLILDWIDQGAPNNSCPDAACDTLEVTWSGDIQAMVQNRCQGCHSGTNAQADLHLTNYTEVAEIANNGNLISALYGINYIEQMPLNNPLNDCQVRMFEIWIENGALED